MNCLASCGAPAGRRLFPRLFLPLAIPARFATAAFATAVFLTCLLAHGRGRAADWPQILGSARNGVADNERLAEKWPADGPPRKWKIEVGSGYAGPAVVGTTVVVFHRIEDKERVQAVHLNTGKTLWTCDFLATYRGGVNADRGPRCVPLIHGQGAGGRVYVFGAAGDLHCLRLRDGKKLWSRATYADFQGNEGFFGAGSSPILLGNRLLVNVGGRVAGLVAFDPETGKTVWQKTEEKASYSSPSSVDIDGRTYAVFVTRYNVVALDPRDGNELLRFEFGRRGPTVNAATPLISKRQLFVTSSYGVGAVSGQIGTKGFQRGWANDDTLSSQYTTPAPMGDYLFGTHGREDIGTASLRCVQWSTGKVMWSERDFGVAHTILAGKHLLLLDTTGRLTLAAADHRAYVKIAETRLTTDTTRAMPAMAHGQLLFRTSVGDGAGGELHCLTVGAKVKAKTP